MSGAVVDGRRDDAIGRRGGPLTGWTLRRKLVASILALFVVITLVTSAATALLLERSLEEDLDARVVNTAVRALRPGPDSPVDGPGRRQGLGGDFLLLATDDAAVTANVVFTQAGAETALSTQQVAALASASLGDRPATVDLGDGLGRYRLVAVRRGSAVVVTGLPMAPLEASIRRLRQLTLAVGLGGLVLLGLGTTWLVRSSLRPLERVAQTATRVATLPLSSGEVSLAERVPWRDTDTRTEVGQVGAALNELLDHVDVSLSARHESETRLRQFVADASHELRTPLASIRGYAELSRREREPVPNGVRHALTRIESEANRMGALVEDLLLLARLDAGRPLAREPVDLTMLLVDAMSDAQVAGPDHRWRLDLPETAVEVRGDAARLTQVIVNLLANARVHTPAGTTVTGRVAADAQGATIEVEDDGPGIDPELRPRIFARFTRGDSARHRGGGSTGLGLSIVAAVAAAHGGHVDVESRPGRTVFRLRLPSGASAGTPEALDAS
ncbi:sensor histidine kinase [Agilicoccus flavus]|uniref:sensor histidine kinase n=1 Tax=Agilicoccus flavus TaxID=2775968 RepID=UPI001CF677C7|nr:HAMP domain-containing sensor histidine kinase [Agilicoccus flavus]